MFFKALMRDFLVVAVLASAVVTRADVFNMGDQTSLQFVTVGDPGNTADPATGNLYGSVGYTYQMGKYDVTTAQYTAFLNAVATTDTYGLYVSAMADVGYYHDGCGIIQSGGSGSYTYAVATAYQNFPVNFVSWGDAARFCNWLQNGQPTGSQCLTTTEDGSYYLNGATSDTDLMAVTRKANATYVIPSENEWYKAAYYDPNKPGGAGYWTYPTKSNTAPINILSSTGTNNANFFDDLGTGNGGWTDPTNYLTPVGAFSNSPGAYGTYDMGGDVYQWNETATTSSTRGVLGGYFDEGPEELAASAVGEGEDLRPSVEFVSFGFRVASVPEPGSITLLICGAIAGLIWWWRRK